MNSPLTPILRHNKLMVLNRIWNNGDLQEKAKVIDLQISDILKQDTKKGDSAQ